MAAQVTRGYGVLEGLLARKRCAMANRLIPDAARRGRILDIGCGTHPYFLLHTKFSERYGLDKVVRPEDQALFARQGIELANHELAADADLPHAGDAFDVVTMLAVFEHIPPACLGGLLREIHRVLKPGGHYILTTPNWWTDPILKTLALLRLVSPDEIHEHQDAYRAEAIGDLLVKAGFSADGITAGRFELGMNIWVMARK